MDAVATPTSTDTTAPTSVVAGSTTAVPATLVTISSESTISPAYQQVEPTTGLTPTTAVTPIAPSVQPMTNRAVSSAGAAQTVVPCCNISFTLQFITCPDSISF